MDGADINAGMKTISRLLHELILYSQKNLFACQLCIASWQTASWTQLGMQTKPTFNSQ
jgi:hypothetical protein